METPEPGEPDLYFHDHADLLQGLGESLERSGLPEACQALARHLEEDREHWLRRLARVEATRLSAPARFSTVARSVSRRPPGRPKRTSWVTKKSGAASGAQSRNGTPGATKMSAGSGRRQPGRSSRIRRARGRSRFIRPIVP